MTRRTSLELELSKTRPKNAADFGQFGNAAAMREALEEIDRVVFDKRRHTKEEVEAHRLATEALTVPPRNCDRFATVKEAAIAFARERQDAPQPCPDFIFSAWLFAPAAERMYAAKAAAQSSKL